MFNSTNELTKELKSTASMLIRSAQIEQMRIALIQRFENRMLSHVRRLFRRTCSTLTETEIRTRIRNGIQKARGYGFQSELEICKYVNLMFIFGPEFDTQIEPWANACRQTDERAFLQAWEEAYDGLIDNSSPRVR